MTKNEEKPLTPPPASRERGIFDLEFLRANLGNLLILTGSVMFVLLPEYLQSQNMQRQEIGIVDGSFWFVSIFVQPWLGPRLDKNGRKIFLLLGSLLMAVAATSYAWLPVKLAPMVLARIVHGFGFACYLTASWTWVADYAPSHRVGEMFGVFGISGMLSGTIGPGLSELLVRSYGYDHLFFYGASVIFAGWLVMLTLTDRKPKHLDEHQLPSFFKLLGMPGMRGTVVGSIAFGVAVGAIFAFVAPYLATLNIEGVGPLFACTTLASGASRVFAGRLTDQLGPGKLVAPSLVLLAVGTSGLAWVPSVEARYVIPVLVASGLGAGLGYGVVYPALNALAICRLSPAARGRGLSLVTASIDSGSTTGAALVGFVSQHLGYPNGFRAVAATVIVMAILFALVERPQQECC